MGPREVHTKLSLIFRGFNDPHFVFLALSMLFVPQSLADKKKERFSEMVNHFKWDCYYYLKQFRWLKKSLTLCAAHTFLRLFQNLWDQNYKIRFNLLIKKSLKDCLFEKSIRLHILILWIPVRSMLCYVFQSSFRPNI